MTAGRRRRRLRLSLRITLTFTSGALIVAATVATAAYLLTENFLVRQQDRTVLRQSLFNANAVKAGLESGDNPDIPAVLDSLPSGPTVSAVIERSGRWYSSSLTVSRDALPLSMRSTVMDGHVGRMWTRVDNHPAVVVGVPLPAVGGSYFQVADESPLSRTMSALRVGLIAAAGLAAVAGAGLGWWASRRLTAPLRAVAAAAERIATGDLETHLPEGSDREVASLVTTFNGMVDALRARIERDARFAADVSHELRSPLTTLGNSLAVLQGRRAELSPRGQDALNLLATEVARFQRLVDDLLEISRLDAGQVTLEREPVRICQLILNLLADPRYAGTAADVDSTLLDAVVIGDKRRLEQVLRNLLDNALTHAGGATVITVAPSGDGVSVSVDDRGPGVAPDDREQIFERFSRGRNAVRRGSAGGTGLGLALVREHVRAHGGEVRVTAAPGGGSRFVVELPGGEAT